MLLTLMLYLGLIYHLVGAAITQDFTGFQWMHALSQALLVFDLGLLTGILDLLLALILGY